MRVWALPVTTVVDIQPGRYLNMLGAGYWPVPLARLRLGKSGLDFLLRYETVTPVRRNLAITETSSSVNASGKQIFAHPAAPPAPAGAEEGQPFGEPQAHWPLPQGFRMRQTAPLWGPRPHSGRWIMIRPTCLSALFKQTKLQPRAPLWAGPVTPATPACPISRALKPPIIFQGG